ncbi:MAG: methyltransferase domain-containing protein [Candidatus Sungbacteria bacterium]|nr:methyltransferase domain-containing protein [Candidatus Sungbacteria bacterium]
MGVSVLHRLIWIIFRPILDVFCNFTVIGGEHLKNVMPPLIFVSNHESHFDPFLISAALPIHRRIMAVRFFARDIFFEEPVVKHILRMLGAYPGRIGRGLDIASYVPLMHLRNGRSIGIFPEWCFPDEPEASRMRYIGPYVARQSGRPVVPVFLFGIEGFTWWKILSRRKKIMVVFGEPIAPHIDEELEGYTERVERGLLEARLLCVKTLGVEGEAFWQSYAEFYRYLELAEPYREMKRLIRSLLPDEPRGRWLDLGTGSGAMVALLFERPSTKLRSVTATDFSEPMLAIARERFRDNSLVRTETLDLALGIPHSVRTLDGVIANLVLPYVIHHRAVLGRQALRRVLEEIHRVLKPGGFFLWSTPRRNVNFLWVALASWRSFFDREHPEYRSYAVHILRHALAIQEWGRREIYNFPTVDEIETFMKQVGFSDVTVKLSLAAQVYVISARKAGPVLPSVFTTVKSTAVKKNLKV